MPDYTAHDKKREKRQHAMATCNAMTDILILLADFLWTQLIHRGREGHAHWTTLFLAEKINDMKNCFLAEKQFFSKPLL